jgi:hypothetical protein
MKALKVLQWIVPTMVGYKRIVLDDSDLSLIKDALAEVEELEANNKRDAVERMNRAFYVSALENKIAELEKPKLCNTCTHDHCGCSIQDTLLQITPDATFNTFGCIHHELTTPSKHGTIPQHDKGAYQNGNTTTD